jgi:hypothetical protein
MNFLIALLLAHVTSKLECQRKTPLGSQILTSFGIHPTCVKPRDTCERKKHDNKVIIMCRV